MSQSVPRKRTWSTSARWLSAGVLIIVAVTVAVVAERWPFSQDAVTRDLQRGLKGRLVIGQFHRTWFPPGFVAANINVTYSENSGTATLIGVRNVSIRGSYHGLLTHTIGKVQLVGVRLTMPPGGREALFVSGARQSIRGVGEIEINDSVLIAGDFRLQVRQAILEDVAAGRPVRFRASLVTNKPYGELKSEGDAGPWNTAAPDRTPISGVFQYANADLSSFGGLHGILAAKGNFRGTLATAAVSGTLSVPQFQVDGSAHSVNLGVDYGAAVNLRNADVNLSSVEAHIARTTVLAKGTIDDSGEGGKTAHIDLSVDHGRLEDLLNYFSEEKNASMTGAVTLRAFAEVPPGPHFLQKVRLVGDFGVGSAKFTNTSRQIPIDALSSTAQDKASGRKESKEVEDSRTAVSNMRGHVVIRDGLARLTRVSFEFPGAIATMAGTFHLISKQVDIHGSLHTTGSLPDASSGLKKLMLRVATPFMKRGKTTVVPFAITGPSSNPRIHLDLSRKRRF